MRVLFMSVVGLLTASLPACSVDHCRNGTVFLSYMLTNGAENASTIDVGVAIGAMVPQTKSIARKTRASTGSIEIDFSSYPSGQQLLFVVTARGNDNTALASTSESVTAAPGCTTLSFVLDGTTSSDLGVGGVVDSSGGTDGAGASPDLTPTLATARLIAPLSTATVTQRKPTLHWVLGPGAGSPTVDLCKDRACSQPLAITASVSSDNSSAVPTTALPSGWVFWRVRVVDGPYTMTSATWQMWVGRSSASTAVDTSSSGTILDVNGDGYADFLVGAFGANTGAGEANLFLGTASGTFQRIDITDPDDTAAEFGISVSSAGDINGDGYADFLIGSSNAISASIRSGMSHLYFGGPTPNANDWNGFGAAKRVDLAPPMPSSGFGSSVAGAGDINGDGYSDFLVGAPNASSGAGAVSVYLGEPLPSANDWNGALARSRIDLTDAYSTSGLFGGEVAGAGDIDGDGYADFIVGASNDASQAGRANIYFGKPAPTSSDWNGPNPPKLITLISSVGSYFGISVGSAGDINGDGYADFLIGTWHVNSNAGAAYLYLGEPTPNGSDWNDAQGNAGPKRFDLSDPDGANAFFGCSLASAGDVNGDGYGDFLVGAYGANTAGEAHLYLGGSAPSLTDWNGASPTKRLDLLSPNPTQSERFGTAVGGQGDMNGDGYADFLVGADHANTSGGEVHVFLGEQPPSTTDWNGASPAKRIDIAPPDGTNGEFGHSIASRTRRDGAPPKARKRALKARRDGRSIATKFVQR